MMAKIDFSDITVEDVFYSQHQTADLEAAAAAKGLRVVYPEGNQLFIDIDSVQALLCSDPKRELLAYLQGEADAADPISVFFEKAGT